MKKAFLIAIAALLSFGFCDTSVFAQITITEVSNSNNLGEDWFELTNTGETTVDLNGYFWDDDPVGVDDGAIFGDFSLQPGETLIVLEGSELEDGIETTFRAAYGLDAGIQVLTEDDFTGNDTFSGLSSSGDQISLYDTDPNVAGAVFELIDFVEIPPAPVNTDPAFGASFDYTQLDPNGTPSLSVSGTDGALAASNGDVGSPGSIPELGLPLLGDVNIDGSVDFSDIAPFIALLSAGNFQLEADIDTNDVVDFSDIAPFIAILSGA